MSLAIPATEPLSTRAGDSLSWSRSLPEYSAADGWTLKYRILWTTGSSPASFSAAGVGTLGVVDADDVEVVNLQRQILHGTGGIGTPKADSATARLAELDPGVRLVRLQAAGEEPVEKRIVIHAASKNRGIRSRYRNLAISFTARPSVESASPISVAFN